MTRPKATIEMLPALPEGYAWNLVSPRFPYHFSLLHKGVLVGIFSVDGDWLRAAVESLS